MSTEYYQIAPLSQLTLDEVNRLITDLNAKHVQIGTALAAVKKPTATGVVSTLTDQTGGHQAGDVIAPVKDTYDPTAHATAFASITKKINEVITTLKARGIF